jgi:hypothetical protein
MQSLEITSNADVVCIMTDRAALNPAMFNRITHELQAFLVPSEPLAASQIRRLSLCPQAWRTLFPRIASSYRRCSAVFRIIVEVIVEVIVEGVVEGEILSLYVHKIHKPRLQCDIAMAGA